MSANTYVFPLAFLSSYLICHEKAVGGSVWLPTTNHGRRGGTPFPRYTNHFETKIFLPANLSVVEPLLMSLKQMSLCLRMKRIYLFPNIERNNLTHLAMNICAMYLPSHLQILVALMQ